jgi:hypothetical protein
MLLSAFVNLEDLRVAVITEGGSGGANVTSCRSFCVGVLGLGKPGLGLEGWLGVLRGYLGCRQAGYLNTNSCHNHTKLLSWLAKKGCLEVVYRLS